MMSSLQVAGTDLIKSTAPAFFSLDPRVLSHTQAGVAHATWLASSPPPTEIAPLPSTYMVEEVAFPGYRLLGRFQVYVERVADSVLAIEPHTALYGVGSDADEAIAELVSMTIDLFEELSSTESVLSSSLCRQLKYLRSLISRC